MSTGRRHRSRRDVTRMLLGKLSVLAVCLWVGRRRKELENRRKRLISPTTKSHNFLTASSGCARTATASRRSTCAGTAPRRRISAICALARADGVGEGPSVLCTSCRWNTLACPTGRRPTTSEREWILLEVQAMQTNLNKDLRFPKARGQVRVVGLSGYPPQRLRRLRFVGLIPHICHLRA